MKRYDHIVVGAGSAGCAVAARLSEDPDRSVLLVEAGGSGNRLDVLAPLAFSKQFHAKRDWDYFTEPEPGCDGRRIYEPRGKMLGGCSGMNAMLWIRGNPLDYDGWGIDGWSWDEVRPFFERIEHRHNLPCDAPVNNGPVHVQRMSNPDPLAEKFVAAARATGIPANDDLSGPDEGVGIAPVTVRRGRRFSAARAYLAPARGRSNLDIVTAALVHRIVVRDGRAVGIEFERRGRKQTAESSADVVICAGALNTPHLLQLSGIGPAEHLREIGLECVVDSPAVGRHLREHPLTLVNWELREGCGELGLSDAEHPKWLARWLLNGAGKLGSNIGEALAHIRSRDDLPAPDFQIIFGPVFFWKHGSEEHPVPALVMGQSYWTPKSVGTVMAASSDPRKLPEVRLNMLTERDDMDAMIRAIRLSREIAATEPLASVLGEEIHTAALQTDEELEAWIRSDVEHTFHPSCTARMGEPGEGALDSKLRVHGVANLRVADCSALPEVTRANTNAPAIMIGERCADFIRREGALRADTEAAAEPAVASA